jgi:hypothetical protein
MGFTGRVLDEVRDLIDADPVILATTRARLGYVRKASEAFPGSLRSYSSGSIAQGTVIDPVLDADGGIVLDRRSYPSLGPDGGGAGPRAAVEEVRQFLEPMVVAEFPGARLSIGRRSILVTFQEGVQGEDGRACQFPSVDLIVALSRRDAPGLWIPECPRDVWDASDPEGHVALLREGLVSLQRTRRQVIRLSKAWARRYPEPPLCSFNITALALAAVDPGTTLAVALLATLQFGAASLATGPTADPAGIAKEPIGCPDPGRAARMMSMAAGHLASALQRDDNEAAVRDSLAAIFGDLVAPAPSSKAALASVLRGSGVMAAQLGIAAPVGTVVRPVRSWGSARVVPHQ